MKEREKTYANDDDYAALCNRETVGCYQLMYHVLERAVLDYCGVRSVTGNSSNPYYAPTYQKAQLREVRKWFGSKSKAAFSYLWICEHLEISSENVLKFIETAHKQVRIVRKASRSGTRSKFFLSHFGGAG